jgi:hypothetical protein
VVSLLKLKSKGLHNWLLVLYYKCPMRYSGEPQYGNDDFLNHVVDRWNVVDQREKRIVPVAYRLSMNRGRVCSWLLIFQLFSLFCVFFWNSLSALASVSRSNLLYQLSNEIEHILRVGNSSSDLTNFHRKKNGLNFFFKFLRLSSISRWWTG